jgi:hypothetical protein
VGDVGLGAELRTCSSILGMGKTFSVLQMSRLAVGTNQPPIHWVLVVKWPECEDGHSATPNAEVQNG